MDEYYHAVYVCRRCGQEHLSTSNPGYVALSIGDAAYALGAHPTDRRAPDGDPVVPATIIAGCRGGHLGLCDLAGMQLLPDRPPTEWDIVVRRPASVPPPSKESDAGD